MARTALVPGATRGLVLAISTALGAARFRVAAVCHSDMQAAQALAAEHGIAVFQWDVGDAAPAARAAGAVDVLVNNAGILGFSRTLALESAARNITVNAVAPGYCDTAVVAGVQPEVSQATVAGIPVGRRGTPADVARMVAFLADEAAGFITGATFDVNGGQYLA